MRRASITLAVLAAGAGAGRMRGAPAVVTYKQGTYQGKPDTPPYSNAPFNGNEQQWENAIRARNLAQNEYQQR
jgi:hypothetical protein